MREDGLLNGEGLFCSHRCWLTIFGVHLWILCGVCCQTSNSMPHMMRQWVSAVQVRVKVQHLADAAAKMSPKYARFRLAGWVAKCGKDCVGIELWARSFPGTKIFFKSSCLIYKVAKDDKSSHLSLRWPISTMYTEKCYSYSVICTACHRVAKMHIMTVLVVRVSIMEILS